MREKIIDYWSKNVVANAGLIAHGRGEAFDYLIGEETIPPARRATTIASAYMLLAKKPVISVNGNAAALVSEGLVELAEATGASLEVNLFYRTRERIEATASSLYSAGAKKVLGTDDTRATSIPELSSERRIVDSSGIHSADVVLVPLEDGDRTEALRNLRKVVLAVDLNPLSRTSRAASVTVVDNLVRVIPNMVSDVRSLKSKSNDELNRMVLSYDNSVVLRETLEFIQKRLSHLADHSS